jgi:hypothetical protein
MKKIKRTNIDNKACTMTLTHSHRYYCSPSPVFTVIHPHPHPYWLSNSSSWSLNLTWYFHLSIFSQFDIYIFRYLIFRHFYCSVFLFSIKVRLTILTHARKNSIELNKNQFEYCCFNLFLSASIESKITIIYQMHHLDSSKMTVYWTSLS